MNNANSRLRPRSDAVLCVFLPWIALLLVILTRAPAPTYAAPSERSSRIPDEPQPQLDAHEFAQRPSPILELGEPLLGTGLLHEGFTLPTGAVWQPSLLVYGQIRSAVQAFDDGDTTFVEWANRADLFANLQLSGTERILLGIQPLHERGDFSGYYFHPDADEGWHDGLNVRIDTLFFEGDFGELFPNLDRRDFAEHDIGFAIGRQPLIYQEGLLIDDTVDAIGITRNSILPPGGSNMQITFIYGWNNIHRDDNIDHEDNHLLGLFIAADYPFSTLNFDLIGIIDEDDRSSGLFWGVSGVQRFGHFNTSLRLVGSQALQDESEAVSTGYLLLAEVSTTPPWTHDLVYVNAFWGIDEFASAARDEDAGGPLGRTGILFAALGLGRYGAPLGNRADEAVGAAIGYQAFLGGVRKQLIVEFGGRQSTVADGDGALALGARYQQAFGPHTILQLDVFGALQESRDEAWGSRVELRFVF